MINQLMFTLHLKYKQLCPSGAKYFTSAIIYADCPEFSQKRHTAFLCAAHLDNIINCSKIFLCFEPCWNQSVHGSTVLQEVQRQLTPSPGLYIYPKALESAQTDPSSVLWKADSPKIKSKALNLYLSCTLHYVCQLISCNHFLCQLPYV